MDATTKINNILLVVTGLSPQVVTETLFALHCQGHILPDQIHILTTTEGYRRAQLTLINDGWLARFYSDYQLPPPEFSEENIHVLQNSDGQSLDDIRTQTDNQAMADTITEWIRTFTSRTDNSLHVSIAGGRKTMGFYAGYALSLYGRIHDRLSHVLVSADYESHPQFYYPTPYSQVIYGNDPTRKPLDTQNADVMLADIAFVRLRHGLDNSLLQGKSSFSESVARAQRAIGPAHLTIDFKQRSLKAHNTVIKLGPTEFAFYNWLLQRQLAGQNNPGCPADGAPEQCYAEQYIKEYRAICGELGGADRTLQTLMHGMSKAFFEQRKSRINKIMKETLGPSASAYLISAVGKRPRTRYQIDLSKEQIQYQQEKKG
ncbi:MAG: TIGR02584 family CRISPR-associated protein [Methylococcaceae bacterium]|nr:TIGR02584 family CRISPR-associated protein [Methylococcaceae bacterium]